MPQQEFHITCFKLHCNIKNVQVNIAVLETSGIDDVYVHVYQYLLKFVNSVTWINKI